MTPTPSPLAACPATAAPAGPQVLAKNLPAPDDLAFDRGGRLLVSDIKAGTVSALNADGSLEKIAGGLTAPEGMAVQNATGAILVAEQGRNRVVSIDATSHAISLWRVFPNRTGRDGIDGIGPELSNGDIVVPDSPNGVVWRVAADGKTATQIGAGMIRPAGAAVDAQGRIFIADEGGALWVLDPAKRRFATLPTPDDVLVGRDGVIFVNTLGDNAIHEFDGQAQGVGKITAIQQPQGIALDGADNLYYTEFNAGRIDRIIRTFILDPPKVTRIASDRFAICPSIRRVTGFAQSLELATSASLERQVPLPPVVQPGIDSFPALVVHTTAPTITITVRTDTLSLSQTVVLSP